jgi:hypothetical protein
VRPRPSTWSLSCAPLLSSALTSPHLAPSPLSSTHLRSSPLIAARSRLVSRDLRCAPSSRSTTWSATWPSSSSTATSRRRRRSCSASRRASSPRSPCHLLRQRQLPPLPPLLHPLSGARAARGAAPAGRGARRRVGDARRGAQLGARPVRRPRVRGADGVGAAGAAQHGPPGGRVAGAAAAAQPDVSERRRRRPRVGGGRALEPSSVLSYSALCHGYIWTGVLVDALSARRRRESRRVVLRNPQKSRLWSTTARTLSLKMLA